jgi:hypothetical protein
MKGLPPVASGQSFDSEIIEELGWYVYRLIDPRSGHTFYVGKGKGNRVFQHAQNALGKDQVSGDDDDYLDSKSQRIVDIRNAGLEVQHVIHRHKIASEQIAYEIEAALLEAYEGLSNIAGGHENSDKGCAHANELIRKYKARELVACHHLISFSCGNALRDRASAYEACRFAWRLNREKIEWKSKATDRKYKYALAVDRGFVVDVFSIREWLEATPDNFPGMDFRYFDPAELEKLRKSRTGFIGEQATQEILDLYQFTRLPGTGSQNPVRYFHPGDHD